MTLILAGKMLTRKGTISRKNRASLRRGRGRGGPGGGGGGGGGVGSPGGAGAGGGANSGGRGSLLKTAVTWGSTMSPSHSTPVTLKTSTSREASLTSMENYCYAMDNISTNSDKIHDFHNRDDDTRVHNDSGHVHCDGLAKDRSPNNLPVPTSKSLGNFSSDLSSTEVVGFSSYQSMASRKVSTAGATLNCKRDCGVFVFV